MWVCGEVALHERDQSFSFLSISSSSEAHGVLRCLWMEFWAEKSVIVYMAAALNANEWLCASGDVM